MKKTESTLPKRLSSEQVLVAAIAIWQNQLSVAQDISARASKIIQVAYEKDPIFFSGKSAKGILSGLFYQLAIDTVNAKTQQEIARALGTNEMTTRASCRDRISCFPEPFTDKQGDLNKRTAHESLVLSYLEGYEGACPFFRCDYS